MLRAPPGAGKTTRVPPAILDAGIGGPRPGARASAAARRGPCGGRAHRPRARLAHRATKSATRSASNRASVRARGLAVITEGILLRRLLDDPFLPDVGAVVFDEFHERSLASDLALAMVRQIQQTVRPELKIVVMSATLATEPIAAYPGQLPGD